AVSPGHTRAGGRADPRRTEQPMEWHSKLDIFTPLSGGRAPPGGWPGSAQAYPHPLWIARTLQAGLRQRLVERHRVARLAGEKAVDVRSEHVAHAQGQVAERHDPVEPP